MTRRLRQLHAWLGVLFAPSILFFALTGGVQALGWHELKSSPPPWLQHVAQVHKHQTWTLRKRPQAAAQPVATPGARLPDEATRGTPREEPRPNPGQAWLRGFVVLLSLGLAASAALGIWMAFMSRRDRLVNAVLLAIGTVVPVAFVLW